MGPNGAARPRLLTGGDGSPRGFRIAARYADEFNLSSSSPDVADEKFAALDAACEAIGRDPATLARSVMAGTLIGRDEAELDAARSGAPRGVRRRRRAATTGSRAPRAALDHGHAATRRGRWSSAFADGRASERLMLQDFLPRDLEMIDLMAESCSV